MRPAGRGTPEERTCAAGEHRIAEQRIVDQSFARSATHEESVRSTAAPDDEAPVMSR